MVIERNRLSYADYQSYIAQPERAGRIFELIDGAIVEKMPSFKSSRIAGWIITYLNLYLLQNPRGFVTGADGGYRIAEDEVLIPDVGYIARERLPHEPEREVPTFPDLAVEVKSPTDTKRALRRKAEKYLAAGTRLVWLVFPDEHVVEVYMPDEDVMTVGTDAVLDGSDVLPGFTVKVADLLG